MKKKIKKISIIFVLTVVLFSCLASTCFAWESPPDYSLANSQGYSIKQYGYALYENNPDKIAWVFLEYRLPDGSGGYTFNYMYFVDAYVMAEWLGTYIESNSSIPTLEQVLTLYKATLTQYAPSGVWSLSVLDEQINRTYLSALPLALYSEQEGYNRGFESGKELSYNQGYSDGLAESDIAENTILTIFSAPTYILATIFDFELFGINVYSLICFFLTLTIVVFILKRVL